MNKNGKLLIVIVLLSIFHFTPLSAQQINVNWSPEFEEEKGESLGRVLLNDGENIFIFVKKINKKGKDTVTPGIMKLDRKMQPVLREDYTTDNEDVKFDGVIYLDGNFLLMTSKKDKQTNTVEVYAAKIDKKTLKISGKPSMIYKTSAPVKKDIYWSYEVSEDSTLLLISASVEQKGDDKRTMAYRVIDSKFTTVQEKMVVTDYEVDNSKILDLKLSRTGDVYLAMKGYFGSAKKETKRGDSGEKQASYDMILKRYNKDGTIKNFNIPMGKHLLESFSLATDPTSDDLLLIATYQDVSKHGLVGYIFLRINSKTGEVTTTKENKFTLAFIERVNDLNVGKTKGEFPGIATTFELTDFIINPDGTIIGILESNYITSYTDSRGYTHTIVHSDGMVIFEMDNQGNQKWINTIPKIQANSLSYMYHTSMVWKDKLYVFYNDTEKNLEYDLNSNKSPRPFAAMKEMTLIMVTIDEKGNMSRKAFSNSDQMETNILTSLSKQVGEDSFVLYGYKYRKQINKIGIANFK